MQTGCRWVNLRDRDRLEFLGLRGRILLEQILIKCDEIGVNRIHLVQARDKWRALVNTVMNLLVL